MEVRGGGEDEVRGGGRGGVMPVQVKYYYSYKHVLQFCIFLHSSLLHV